MKESDMLEVAQKKKITAKAYKSHGIEKESSHI